ncbi:M48 family metalloprotease [Streptomyces sp. NPDC006012]|uniref:M48 family metalloprotease n=1 Tax=Streptomyces sp. NPDC006012 TaxID=3364739 RepID=UPI0036971B73
MRFLNALRSGNGTGPRFALLVALVVAAGATTLDVVLSSFHNIRSDSSEEPLKGAFGCMLAAGIDPSSADADNINAITSRMKLFDQCIGAQPTSYEGVIGTLVLFAVAAAIYWLLPVWRNRPHRLVPVEAVDADGALRAELAALCERAMIRSRVRFRVDPRRMTAGACVFGRAGSYTVSLHAGLLARRGVDPEGFRAVVLHELAHLHQRDVDYAYAGTALWRAFVLGALVPQFALVAYLVVLVLTGTESPFWNGGKLFFAQIVFGLFLAALVHLARADLLRRRELQADLQAVTWGAHPAGWYQPERPGRVPSRLRRATALLRTHPDWAERRLALADPERSARITMVEMFLTGASAALLAGLAAAVQAVPYGTSIWITVVLAAAVPCSVLGLRVVRSRRSRHGRAESGAFVGLWFGLGLMTGDYVVSNLHRSDWLLPEPLYLLAFLFIAAVPVVWWSQSLNLALGLPTRGRRWTAAAVCVLTTVVLLWDGLQWWRLGGERIALGAGDVNAALETYYKQVVPGDWSPFSFDLRVLSVGMAMLTPLFNEALTIGAAALLWLTPLVLMLTQRVRAGVRLRRTLLWGVAGGLLSWGALAVALAALHAHGPVGRPERAGPFFLVSTWWTIVVAVAAPAVTAAVVAAVSRRHWMPRALIAGQVAQLMAYAAAFLFYSADGCLGPLNNATHTCGWNASNGTEHARRVIVLTLADTVLAVACAALVGAAAAWAVRTVRGRPTDVPAWPAPSLSALRRPALLGTGLLLALSVPALLLTGVTSPRVTVSADEFMQSRAQPQRQQPVRSPEQRARMRSWQAWAWMYHGGNERSQRIRHALERLTRLLGDGQQQGAQPDWDAYRRICAAVDSTVADAGQYFPVPLADLQKEWASALSTMRQGTRRCVTVTGTPAAGQDSTQARNATALALSVQQIVTGAVDWQKASVHIRDVAGGGELPSP